MKLRPSPIIPEGAAIAAIALLAVALAWIPLQSFAQFHNGHRANAVVGQLDFTTSDNVLSATGFGNPSGIAIDPASGKVFVSDTHHHRILRFSSTAAMAAGAPAELVFGQPNFTTANPPTSPPTQFNFNSPRDLAVDSQGRLWVADTSNHRVMRFDDASNLAANQPNANGVLGQANFTTKASATSATGMNVPSGVNVDWGGRLWVADTFNHRVLRFDDAANKANGAAADGVLGQSLFTTNSFATTASGMRWPRRISTRLVTTPPPFVFFLTELWVTDADNHRVLRFDNAANKANGGPADGVLGQANFTSGSPGTSQSTLRMPTGIHVLPNGDLWVADTNNNRLLFFADAVSQGNGAPADTVVGKSNFTIGSSSAPAQDNVSLPQQATVDGAGNLFVTDFGWRRVLRFTPGNPQPDALVGKRAGLSSQRGDNIFNTSAAGQTIRIRERKRQAKVHFTLQNEGPFADEFRLRATRRNQRMQVRYFRTAGGRANITAQAVTGNLVDEVGYQGFNRYLARTRITKKGLLRKKTTRPLSLQATSLFNAAADRVRARVILVPGL